ncbi:MAG TPA: hypothetical protein VLQ67_10840, partial [Arachnia sp.]|nr:hypothetical protein [Arachnia sp.]
MKRPTVRIIAFAGIAAMALAGCTADPQESESPAPTSEQTVTGTYTEREVTDGSTAFMVVENPGEGPTLSYGAESGITLLEEEIEGATYAFKDMNANGELDAWEDWRLDSTERAADLAEGMSIEQIAGLMLFSSHERTPADGLTDAQKTYLSESNLRNVLNA